MTLAERAHEIHLAQTDPEYRVLFNSLCAKDDLFFANTCCWVFEPRAEGEGKDIPFLAFPVQEGYLRELGAAIDKGYDLLTEKTRDQGATWSHLIVILKRWLFERGFTALVGSFKEDEVDQRGNPKTLFWKLEYLIRHIQIFTPWLLPPHFKLEQPYRTFMRLINPGTGAVISGDTANPDFGRGDRKKVIFFDELGAWEFAQAAWTASSQTTRCHLVNSTPRGMNFFGKLANPEPGNPRPIRKISLHWLDNPLQNGWVILKPGADPAKFAFAEPGQMEDMVLERGAGRHVPRLPEGHTLVYPWYERERARLQYDPVSIAQELDIDYNKSVVGQMYTNLDRAMVGHFDYDPSLSLYTGWDFGLNDYTSIVWIQFDHFERRWRIIDSYQNRGKSIRFYVPIVLGPKYMALASEQGMTEHDETVIRRHGGWRYTSHFGDPSGRNGTLTTATSIIQELKGHGIYVEYSAPMQGYNERFEALRGLLPLCDFNAGWTDDLQEAIRNARWAPPAPGAPPNARPKPVHDQYSHYRSAMEYFAVNNPDIDRAQGQGRAERTRHVEERPVCVWGSTEIWDRAQEEIIKTRFSPRPHRHRARSRAGY